MDAAALFASAGAHYVNEEYEEALKHYTCAVTLQDCADFRAARAATFLKLGKFAQTLEDAAAALNFEPKSHMALHWRGIALFYMGEFASAKLAFEESLRASPAAKAPRSLWIRKCDAELSGSALPLGGLVAEVSKASVAAAAVAAAPTSVSTCAAPALPQELPAEPETHVMLQPAESSASTAVSSGCAPSASSELTISGRKPVKREWYQSSTMVFITIFAKGVQQDECKVDFKERELSLSFPLPGSVSEEYQLDLELFDAIDPAACKLEVSKVKVEVSLAKKDTGVQWKDLEKVEEEVLSPDQPAYPTSSKQKKNWGQIDRDMEQELKNEKPAGDEALNTLFKQIYDRADDETRRAMNKSFQTSGGTVLSTNWGEVAKSDYEGKDRPTPPDGQEWRDWRKK